MDKLNRRQRVLNSVAHRSPDRVAVDFGGHRSSGIMAIAYAKLRNYLGLEYRLPRVYDVIQQLAIVDEDVLNRFEVDTVELGRAYDADARNWKPWRLPDGTECLVPAWADLRRDGADWLLFNDGQAVGIQKAGSLYFEQLIYPFVDALPDDFSDLPRAMSQVMWGVRTSSLSSSELTAGAAALRNRTDRAILGLFGGNLMEWGQFLCRNDCFLELLAGEPDKAHRLLDSLVQIHLENLAKFLAAVGQYIDIILFGDDLGMQTGPQVSPSMYREFFKPRHAAMWKRAKELAPHIKVMLHCCGGVEPLLDDLIAAGLDAINPVQISCAGMDPRHLKQKFGQRLCFWGGGCDTRSVLPKAPAQEVRRHVLDQLRIFASQGGFVFQQVHNIMADVPPENIVAMFDAIQEYNRRG